MQKAKTNPPSRAIHQFCVQHADSSDDCSPNRASSASWWNGWFQLRSVGATGYSSSKYRICQTTCRIVRNVRIVRMYSSCRRRDTSHDLSVYAASVATQASSRACFSSGYLTASASPSLACFFAARCSTLNWIALPNRRPRLT